ncbi:MAG: AAA family ATPase [Dehalococcoidia bacterium]
MREFGALQRAYSGINLHRNWTFGPRAPLRTAPRADERFDVLQDGGGNLALVISNFPPPVKRRLVESLRELIDGVQGIDTPARAGIVDLFLDEGDDRQIPASRLSDGTLRYLSLLAILLNPEPPPLVAIEEPELGLHPDVIPHIAKLLVEASSRMQLVVTTHSRMLVDCLNETPESVVVCERVDGESQFRRLDPEVMKHWLDKYSLGELWSDGVIGGNRW